MLEFQQKGENMNQIPLFQGIEENDIPIMLKKLNAHIKTYEAGEYIKNAGDSADFIGIVLDGNIQILQHDYSGNRSITATIGKGELFAEAFACAGIFVLPVDILSSNNSKIMFLNRDQLFGICDHRCKFHNILMNNLLRILSRKNMMLNQKLQYSYHKTTSEKIMAYLNDQAKVHQSTEFTIPFDRQELADYLGVERSAMSAEISKLVKNGVIETKRSYFKLNL